MTRSVLLRMKTVSDKSCRENQNTHFMSNNSLQKIAPYVTQSGKKTAETGRPKMAKRRMRSTCLITTATDTHSECIIIIGFPRQQWLRERVSMLRYMHIAWRIRAFVRPFRRLSEINNKFHSREICLNLSRIQVWKVASVPVCSISNRENSVSIRPPQDNIPINTQTHTHKFRRLQ